jgi:hypothetical protein
VVWRDHRNATYDVCAQRISSGGVAMWTTDGALITEAYC